MAPKFSKGTAVPGVVAYQDHEDPSQFHYLPSRIPLILGDNLDEFSVKYWGIGKPFWYQDSSGAWKSGAGAVLSGRATLDITKGQRDSLISELKNVYKVNPKLLPLAIKEPTVQPVLGASTLGVKNDGDQIFPSAAVLGSSFNYLVGAPNGLFATFVGAATTGKGVTPDSSFGINVTGKAEFVGDPWKAKIKANLRNVWSKVRNKANASVGVGWWSLTKAQYDSITQELTTSKDIDTSLEEGSLDTEKFGRQIFEMVKDVFQAVNNQFQSNEGFFKFEPNPEPADLDPGKPGGWWPWSVKVNLAHSEAHFKQDIFYENTLTYTGRLWWAVPCGMSLAVKCNDATSQYFVDLRDPSTPCITTAKIDEVNARVAKEVAAKKKKIEELTQKYLDNKITPEQFEKVLQLYEKMTFAEDNTAHPEPFNLGGPFLGGLTDFQIEEAEQSICQ